MRLRKRKITKMLMAAFTNPSIVSRWPRTSFSLDPLLLIVPTPPSTPLYFASGSASIYPTSLDLFLLVFPAAIPCHLSRYTTLYLSDPRVRLRPCPHPLPSVICIVILHIYTLTPSPRIALTIVYIIILPLTSYPHLTLTLAFPLRVYGLEPQFAQA
jgi:hypothetical protein